MQSYLTWALSTLGLALVACAAVTGGWLVARRLALWRGTTRGLVLAWVVVAIAVMTLRPGHEVEPGTNWQFIPFQDLIDSFRDGPASIRLAIADIIANVLLFLPFGAALVVRWPDLRLSRIVLVGAVFSAIVETIQGVVDIGRTAQLTDVLMNVVGTGVGWWLLQAAQRSRFVSDVARRRRSTTPGVGWRR
jgi:glycopeptide antibiotics resistance protein